MRIERSITTVSWIPSDLIEGMGKLAFSMGVVHHDQPPPDTLGADVEAALEQLRAGDRFRFANRLAAYIDVDDAGLITGYGCTGGGLIGVTRMGLGIGSITIPAVKLPDRVGEPEVGDGYVRFSQTVGGRTGAPMPRAVPHPPFVQYHAPIVWTTLELTIHVDGTHDAVMTGASGFPRHWVFDDAGTLVAKSSLAAYKAWMADSFGRRTPWGDEDSPALVTAVESQLERELQGIIMHGRVGAAAGDPDEAASGRDRHPQRSIRRLKAGTVLVEQGARDADELFLLLDGVLVVEVDGHAIAEIGPGAILGERAILERGVRTATLRAVTACKVAVAPVDLVDRERLARLAAAHHREETLAAR